MQLTELEQAIEDLISQLYCSKYNKGLKVKETFTFSGEHLGYILELNLNKDERPFTIAMDGNEEDFLCFVKCQLKFSGLNRIDYFEGTQCTPCNEQCS